MRLTSFASSAGRRTAPAALILLLALLAGTWAAAQVASTGRAPAEPPGQSLAGSFVVFDPSQGGVTSYQPGFPQDFCFRAESFTNDWEYVYTIWLRFPAGWVVNNVTVVGTPSCTSGTWGSLSWAYETPSHEIRINHSRYQSPTDHCVAYYLVNATPAAGVTDAPVSWYWDGDDYGGPPHAPCSSDNYTPPSMGGEPCDQMANPQAVIPVGTVVPQIVFMPDALTASGCPGEPQTHTLHLFNNTGAAGTFNLSYDVTTANGTLTGPASVTAANGETVAFDVYLTPGSGTVEGEIVTAVTTASGGGYTDAATITKTVDDGGWMSVANDLGVRMDNVSAGYAGQVWSIAGYGGTADVRAYDPTANVWTSIAGSNAPFGTTGYPRSGATWGNKVYVYGDASGYSGLVSYNMDTNAWVTETPSGTAPAQTGIWAPAWVTDPATGLLYLTGGGTAPGGGNLTTVYVYDPVLNAWQAPLPNFTTNRAFHAAFIFTRPADGHKLLCVAGGVTATSVTLTSTQCYDFTTGTWGAENADVPALPFDLWGMGYAQNVDPVSGPRLWLTGGVTNGFSTLTNYAYYYDVNTGAWVNGGPFTGPAVYRTSATMLNNEIYKVDGSTGGFTPSSGVSRLVVCGAAAVCVLDCSVVAAPDSGVAPLEVAFTSTVDAQDCADPIEYWWDFGDGETSAEANPVHTYYDGGYYDWTLTVTSGATVCTTTGGIYVDPFDLSFTDDAGRGRLCANSVTGFFMWFLTAGPYKGYYVWGYAMTSEEPGLLTISSPPWATSWQMIFRYFPEQHRAAGTMYLRGYQLTSAISDRVTTNDPDGCNSIF